MKYSRLTRLIFMALCCDLGLFTKRLIAPAANLITDSLHIPGGITTAFSLMFLVIAVALMPKFGMGTLMGTAQSGLAFAMGMVGSMGALAPIGYIMPGLVIDCVFWITRRLKCSAELQMLIANSLAGVTASLTANLIVFRLRGVVLLLYLAVAATCGAVCGLLAGWVTGKLKLALGKVA